MTLRELATSGPQPAWLRWLFVIGLATLITRLVLTSEFGNTAVFYVLVPFIIGLLIYVFIPPTKSRTKWGRASRHFRTATIVMFASSALLMEGFICVVFAFPIYLLFAGVILAVMPPPQMSAQDKRAIGRTFQATAIPLAVVALSIEGITPGLSFERDHSVTQIRRVAASVDEIHTKLAEPITLTEENRSRFLSVFPLPHTIEAGTLAVGDIHTTHFTYKRWIVGNAHEGRMEVEITEVTPHRIRTRVLRNDAYFSHYLTVKGTRIDLAPQADGTTEVSLTLDYRRDLDPAWYFGPLQRRAMTESADYLIGQILTP